MGKKISEDTIKKIAKGVVDAAEPIIKDVKEAADPIINNVMDRADPIINNVKDKADPILKGVKDKADPIIKDVTEVAEPILSDVKGAAKSVGDSISIKATKGSIKEEVYVQYGQHEIRTIDIMDKAKTDYLSRGHKVSEIKEIQVYIKPSDNAAYYVVNHSETGKIEF